MLHSTYAILQCSIVCDCISNKNTRRWKDQQVFYVGGQVGGPTLGSRIYLGGEKAASILNVLRCKTGVQSKRYRHG